MRAPAVVIFGVVLALTPVAAVAGLYEDGQDAYVSGNYATALRLWLPLAEQGIAAAQFNLGNMYRQGQGVPQDPAEAVKWFRLAAEQGIAAAQFNLGASYERGQGVPRDVAEAAKWYRLVAAQGYAAAQYNLGHMYRRGEGVPQDYVQAHRWSSLAASRLPPGEDRDRAVESRDWVAKRMTPTKIAEAQKLAREWRPVGERAD